MTRLSDCEQLGKNCTARTKRNAWGSNCILSRKIVPQRPFGQMTCYSKRERALRLAKVNFRRFDGLNFLLFSVMFEFVD